MAWTSADLAIVEAAIRDAMTSGIASVALDGQSVTTYTLEQLRAMRNEIKAEIAAANANSLGGLRMRKTIPPAAG